MRVAAPLERGHVVRGKRGSRGVEVCSWARGRLYVAWFSSVTGAKSVNEKANIQGVFRPERSSPKITVHRLPPRVAGE